ncbi:MAG: amidohydrolase family protein, partial [Woeseia sp.]
MLTKTITLLAISLSLTLTGCSRPSSDNADAAAAAADQPAIDAADLVLRGGKIATVDPSLGTAEALAVKGFEIAAIGSNSAISGYIGPDTRVVELNGRLAMPGFIEGHGHFMSLGRAKQILDLSTVKNWNEVVRMVATAVDKAQPGEWIFGRGWHQDKWDTVPEDAVDGVPRNDTLSEISPDNPVLLGHASGHAAFANDAALAEGYIDGDTPDPAGGTIVRAPDGEATGLLRETAQRLLNDAVDQYNSRLTLEERHEIDRQRVQL